MVIKCPTLKRTVKKLFTLQSMSVHLLLQSSITAMQLIGKKDLKTSLLNKYVLSCFSEKLHFEHGIQCNQAFRPYSRVQQSGLEVSPDIGDRSKSLMALMQSKLFNTGCTFWCHSKHERNHISKLFPKSRSVHMGNNLSCTFPH